MSGQPKSTDRVYTRRDFFSYLLPALSIPALLWWLMVGGRDSKLDSGDKILVVDSDLPAGVSFAGGAILVKDSNGLRAFEAKCTHLGCIIKRAEGNELLCPCHGSRFDLRGKPVKGPAARPLKELKVSVDLVSGNYEIRLQE